MAPDDVYHMYSTLYFRLNSHLVGSGRVGQHAVSECLAVLLLLLDIHRLVTFHRE